MIYGTHFERNLMVFFFNEHNHLEHLRLTSSNINDLQFQELTANQKDLVQLSLARLYSIGSPTILRIYIKKSKIKQLAIHQSISTWNYSSNYKLLRQQKRNNINVKCFYLNASITEKNVYQNSYEFGSIASHSELR